MNYEFWYIDFHEVLWETKTHDITRETQSKMSPMTQYHNGATFTLKFKKWFSVSQGWEPIKHNTVKHNGLK